MPRPLAPPLSETENGNLAPRLNAAIRDAALILAVLQGYVNWRDANSETDATQPQRVV